MSELMEYDYSGAPLCNNVIHLNAGTLVEIRPDEFLKVVEIVWIWTIVRSEAIVIYFLGSLAKY